MAWSQSRALIARFNQGDVTVLQEMYDLYKRDMMTLAMALLFDKAVAEDVLHEVFVKLIGLLGRTRIQSTLRGYLLKAVANEARTVNRAKARQGPVMTEALDSAEHRQEPSACGLVLAEERDRLRNALGELPFEQREVVLLRHYGQMPFKMIAQHQGVSMSAVQARYRYGLKKLRSLLGGHL